MIDDLIHIFKRLLKSTDYKHRRYIYEKFNLDNRLGGIIGPRGTGKTTLMLQYIQEKIEDVDECFYTSIDHIYFSKNQLIDLVNELYENYGIRFFFFDEVHKYPNWNQELKNAYLVKDDILFGSKYEIPLYLFGFLY
jgi:predicted AAA+ superfamily ATPase